MDTLLEPGRPAPGADEHAAVPAPQSLGVGPISISDNDRAAVASVALQLLDERRIDELEHMDRGARTTATSAGNIPRMFRGALSGTF